VILLLFLCPGVWLIQEGGEGSAIFLHCHMNWSTWSEKLVEVCSPLAPCWTGWCKICMYSNLDGCTFCTRAECARVWHEERLAKTGGGVSYRPQIKTCSARSHPVKSGCILSFALRRPQVPGRLRKFGWSLRDSASPPIQRGTWGVWTSRPRSQLTAGRLQESLIRGTLNLEFVHLQAK
jgi:hypothetical protein